MNSKGKGVFGIAQRSTAKAWLCREVRGDTQQCEGLARQSTAKAQRRKAKAAKAKHRLVENDVQSEGLAKHGKAKEMQSTDQIGKGSALFRNDTKRHSRDLYRIDLQRKSFDMKGNGNDLHGYDLLRR